MIEKDKVEIKEYDIYRDSLLRYLGKYWFLYIKKSVVLTTMMQFGFSSMKYHQ